MSRGSALQKQKQVPDLFTRGGGFISIMSDQSVDCVSRDCYFAIFEYNSARCRGWGEVTCDEGGEMKRSTVALIAVICLFVVGARTADDALPETPYYPLKVGNSWTYKSPQVSVTGKVARYEKVGNDLCARIESSIGDKVVTFEDVTVRSSGVYRCAFGDNRLNPPLLFLKLPPKKTQTWPIDTTIGDQKATGTFTGDIADEITVPAGTYKDVYVCTGQMEIGGVKCTFIYYFAKDVGMIKQSVEMPTQKIVVELEKFELAK
jgi:hypothetical protein